MSVINEMTDTEDMSVKSCGKHFIKIWDFMLMDLGLEKTELLPASSCYMLKIGIKTGTADVAMKDIAARLSDEANDELEGKISKIEPLLVIVTSILVGAILLSVMLPLINIMNTIG